MSNENVLKEMELKLSVKLNIRKSQRKVGQHMIRKGCLEILILTGHIEGKKEATSNIRNTELIAYIRKNGSDKREDVLEDHERPGPEGTRLIKDDIV